eukprot:766161-Hanusia_phi.AAC.1
MSHDCTALLSLRRLLQAALPAVEPYQTTVTAAREPLPESCQAYTEPGPRAEPRAGRPKPTVDSDANRGLQLVNDVYTKSLPYAVTPDNDVTEVPSSPTTMKQCKRL